ncbi:MAG: aminotransferase class V-fold PLP-dependent enzyme, partial [Erysipelotrichaceae bacterium]
MIYLDYASTTPLNEEVLETYTRLLKEYYANADSMHDLGMKVEMLQKQSRESISKLLKVKSEEIIFTSGASEANNLAIKGYAFKNKKRGKHIISTRVEHSSIFNALKQLKEEFGYEITLLNTNSKGQVELEELKKYLREDTILVSIMGINNESGAIQPIKEIAEYVHNNSRAVVHMDAVQMLGKMEIDLSYIDMASFSAHKIYGLKGSGILYKKNIIELMPIINGGQQEYGLRGG